MLLRDYQRKAVNHIFEYLEKTSFQKNPCVVAPTGSGKSVIIATFLKEACQLYPDNQFLMLTHQKELIEQDIDKLLQVEPGLDIGVYSASLGKKDLDHKITFASIQSLVRVKETRQYNFILVDECHLINNKEGEGSYRKLLETQKAYVVIGFTATPFRMQQGQLVEDGSLFDGLIETVGVLDLQQMGYLSRLTTKMMLNQMDVRGIKKVAGEFNQAELDERVNTEGQNKAISHEIVSWLNRENRQHCIVFCVNLDHAQKVTACLEAEGCPSSYVDGTMNKDERERAFRRYTSGKARCLVNVGVCTTGFDYPPTDCIALMRPTASTGLYLQMVGRGIRISLETGKKNCLLLDFGGNVMRHGPIGMPHINIRKSSPSEIPALKTCPICLEAVPRSTMVCPACLYEWPVKEVRESKWEAEALFQGDANGDEGGRAKYIVESWNWVRGEGKNEPHYRNWQCTYTLAERSTPIREWFTIDERNEWATRKSTNRLFSYCSKFGIDIDFYRYKDDTYNWLGLIEEMEEAGPPYAIYSHKEGSFDVVDELVTMERARELLSIHFENKKEKEEIRRKQIEILNTYNL